MGKHHKTFRINHLGEQFDVYPKQSRYPNFRLKVILCEDNGDEFDTITINIDDKQSVKGDPTLAFVDIISYPWLVKFLEDNKIAFRTGKFGNCGLTAYPELKFLFS